MVALDGDPPVALVGHKGEGAVLVGLPLQPYLALVEKTLRAAEFCLEKLGADIVVVKDVFYAVLFKAGGDHIDIVRRIAAVDHVKADLPVDLFRQPQLLPQGGTVLAEITNGAVALGRQRVTEDMHAVQRLFLCHVAFADRADHGDGVAVRR